MPHIKDSYYFSHDFNASSDLKIVAMMKTYKVEGYGRYWLIVEMLAQEPTRKLEMSKWVMDAVAKVLGCDTGEAEDYISDCIQIGLFCSDGQQFWSDSLIRRMNKREEIRQKRSDSGKKSAAKRQQTGNSYSASVEQNPTNVEQVKESKGKEKESKSKVNKTKYADNVKMTTAEYQKLVERFGQRATDKMIVTLDNYKGSTGKSYKCDYRAILSWVVNRYEEGERRAGRKPFREENSPWRDFTPTKPIPKEELADPKAVAEILKKVGLSHEE